eukprot:5008520-Pyramimonas_sp.AAC.1
MRPGCPWRAPLQPRARPAVARGCPLENPPGAAPARSGRASGSSRRRASMAPRTRTRTYSRGG